ncbi:TCF20 factor, partial [Amia calva]|nr:TCF20 factor [Amia calva]
MEPPTPNQSDGLHPQPDLAPCSLSTVYDLTRKRKENLLRNNSVETMHVVSAPSWYINPGNKGIFQENNSDHTAHQNEKIQPDDAFSNTTVTLSYVSRSHVFTSQDSLSQLPLCVPSVNKKLSCHSPPYSPDMVSSQYEPAAKENWEANEGLCVEVDRPFLQNNTRPGVAAQSELNRLEESGTQGPHPTESIKAACLMEEAFGQNGKLVTSSWGAEKPELAESTLTPGRNEGSHMQNGTDSYFQDTGLCEEKAIESPPAGSTEEGKKTCDSEVLVVISRTEEPLDLQDSPSSRNVLCSPANGGYDSPLEENWSPATSQDKLEEISVFPHTLNSPSFENSSLDEAADTTFVTVGEDVLVDSAVTGSTVTCLEDTSALQDSCSKGSDVTEGFVICNGIQVLPTSASEPPVEWSVPCDGLSEACSEIEGKACNTQEASVDILPNGNALTEERTFERKKLPPRSRRGRRLEEIVQNITPTRYRASANFHSTKLFSVSAAQDVGTHQEDQVSLHEEVLESGSSQDSQEKVSGSEEEPSLKATVLQTDSSDGSDGSRSKKSTSGQKNRNVSLHSSSSPESPVLTPKCVKKRQQLDASPPKCSPEKKNLRASSKLKLCQKSPTKQPKSSPGSTKAATGKKTRTTKRKRKKRKVEQSSPFAPNEPEIKLKYVNFKEEKRDSKVDSFSPYVRLELKEYATCTVINYPEEEKARLKNGKAQVGPAFATGSVPTTSCLLPGRLNTESKRRGHLICCLCGRSANTMDLGDLHGPYYPKGFKPSPKRHADVQSSKEEDYSDSDSSCSGRGKKLSQAGLSVEATSRPVRQCQAAKREPSLLGMGHRWPSDRDCLRSPVAKKPKTDSSAEDWFSPPLVPLDSCEYWVHEECAIWSAGVYLVRGKLYGLEEGAKLAQETVCTTCHRTGATLGCFFKACPNKYHYTCAVQSDCVLNEENFSMKCTKHKNKSFKGSTFMNRLESR